ncbi:translation elongation factor G [Drancourtella sp. An210]|nr:translation elongation factor G [Drancourtella sp. An210]
MENTSENRRDKLKKNPSKHICTGLLAHVDAGKTTLAESILYFGGRIRKLGRVDHKDAFLDTHELEKNRGITIFSKQAEVSIGEKAVTLLDTPGHVDFSAEMERTLQVLDYAILIISGADGVQGHVETLWKLLDRYGIPVFIFVNKMDQEGTDKESLLKELKERLDERCIDFRKEQKREEFLENIAVCDDSLLEAYLETGEIEDEAVRTLIRERRLFPCCFGSALRTEGVEDFLEIFSKYTSYPEYPDTFGAKVYKIARDPQGMRLTYMKVTGGSLKVKALLSNRREGTKEQECWEEKVHQIRIYSGAGFETAEEVQAGAICAVTGLTHTFAGEGLGFEPEAQAPVLEPVLSYQIQLPEGTDVHRMFGKLKELEEEIPELHIVWREQANEIHAQVMGEVQIEILKSLISERFHTEVEFGTGSILYKETIADTVEGVGHFEPLRHYAEVHLLLEPGEPGSGLVLETSCSEDVLDKNWQRLILTHLAEKKHPGVLTGSEITDMKLILAAGRAHQKHTEGGDFRQATYRAVRHGLKKAKSILLEPVYEFTLEVPSEMVGRAMADIQRMSGSFETPENEGDMAVLRGSAPVSEMQGYQMEVMAYTKGRGRFSCMLGGYEPCHNAEEVIAAIAYDSEADTENPTGSVFCAHGAGFYVEWDKVEEYMHLESCLKEEVQTESVSGKEPSTYSLGSGYGWGDDKELEEIFTRTYGPGKERKYGFQKKTISAPRTEQSYIPKKRKDEKEYLLVDGYNIIFAWDELKELSKINIEAARNKLMDILSNYQGYKKNTLILVFDAYKVPGNIGEVQKYHNIYVVYTKEAETADQYIEKTVHEIGRKYHVTVATSDGLEQIIIMGQGAQRLSAMGLLEEIEAANTEIREIYLKRTGGKNGNYLFDHLPEEMTEKMEEIRIGKKKTEI